MTARRALRAVFLVGAVAILATVQVYLTAPRSTLLWKAVFDAGHAPLFGVLAVVVLWLLDAVRPDTGRPRIRRYALAFVASALAGAVLEATQFFGPRDAELVDLARDAVGSAGFLLFVATFDDRLAVSRKALSRAIAVLMVAAALAPAMHAAAAYAARAAVFPRIAGFGSPWERYFLATNPHAGFEWRESSEDDAPVFVATFRSGRYAILGVEPAPDWSRYDRLRIDFVSALDHDVPLSLKIEDEHDVPARRRRFHRLFRVPPGTCSVTVELDDIREEGDLDLKNVRRVQLFASEVTHSFSLAIDEFTLE